MKIVSLSRKLWPSARSFRWSDAARGGIVAVMDADLQDPPEQLVRFIEKIREGWDVVYAIRTKRKGGILNRVCYSGYYRILKQLAVLDIPLDTGDFL